MKDFAGKNLPSRHCRNINESLNQVDFSLQCKVAQGKVLANPIAAY